MTDSRAQMEAAALERSVDSRFVQMGRREGLEGEHVGVEPENLLVREVGREQL